MSALFAAFDAFRLFAGRSARARVWAILRDGDGAILRDADGNILRVIA
jgi:hypothetical protein